MRTRLAPALALLATLLLAGHVYYWYWPRERPAVAEADGSLARAMAAGGFDACFWAPFPHQNLGVLGHALGDWRGYLAAAARVADLPPPSVPAFGPFAIPAARDIAACSGAADGRLVVSARIYPTLALIAKAAGRLAGNPWLAGGDVEDERRPTRVSWEGSRWTVTVGGAGEEGSPSAAPPRLPALPAALAVVVLGRAAGSFPAGSYLLQRPPGASADLELALGGGAGETDGAAAPFEPDLGASPPVLLAAAGSEGGKPAAAFALFPAISHGSFDLPGAAVFHPPGGAERWPLPAQGLLGLLGGLARGGAAGWSIVAFDAASLGQAVALAPALARLVPPAAAPPAGPARALRLGIWLRPDPALRLVADLRKICEQVPLVERRQVQRFRDWEALLTPLARCRRAALLAAGPPDSFAVRLSGCD